MVVAVDFLLDVDTEIQTDKLHRGTDRQTKIPALLWMVFQWGGREAKQGAGKSS